MKNSPFDSLTDFDHFTEVLPAIIFTADRDGTVDYFSNRWAEFTGSSRDDPDYLIWHPYIHPEDVEKLSAGWSVSVKRGETFEDEFRLKAADGEYRWVTTKVVPIKDRAGQIQKWYGVTTDIDEQKRMELKLRELAERKDQFLAMLGHELRNPLAAVRASLDIAIRPDASDDQRIRAQDILSKQVDHLIRLVDDTLDVSRLSSGKLRLVTCPVELNQLVQDCCDSYAEQVSAADLEISFTPDSEAVWVNGDDTRIFQCLTNLIQNSIKFTDPGGEIHLSLKSTAKTVSLKVRDTGAGMTLEELSRIFEPFEQGSDAHRLSTAGLGLGLAVIDKLVKIHGGKISAKSKGRGHGSEFTITLPRCEAPIETPTDLEHPSHQSSLIIALIEDNESVARSLEMFFELEGHQVHLAADGAAALTLLEEVTPDLIFSDLTLPGILSGWDIAEKISGSYPETLRPYLVALSGHTQPHHRERSMEVGFDDHLAKPPTPDQLRATIDRAKGVLAERRTLSAVAL